MRDRNGTWHRYYYYYYYYYYCRNHDPIKAGGDDRRCTERNIRSDTLDTFVFEQVRAALLRPEVLTAGEQATLCHDLTTGGRFDASDSTPPLTAPVRP